MAKWFGSHVGPVLLAADVVTMSSLLISAIKGGSTDALNMSLRLQFHEFHCLQSFRRVVGAADDILAGLRADGLAGFVGEFVVLVGGEDAALLGKALLFWGEGGDDFGSVPLVVM